MKYLAAIAIILSALSGAAVARADQPSSGPIRPGGVPNPTYPGPTFPSGPSSVPGSAPSYPVTYSASYCSSENLQGFIACAHKLINTATPIVVTLALLYFMWGVSKIVRAQGNEAGRKEGIRVATWGLVALFVMVSVAGILAFLGSDLLGGNSNALPSLQSSH